MKKILFSLTVFSLFFETGNSARIDFPQNIDFTQFQSSLKNPVFEENAWRLGYTAFNYAPELAQYFVLMKQAFQIDTVIETGTFKGGSTVSFANLFEQVHTIEIIEAIYRESKGLFDKFEMSNIQCHLGSSDIVLGEILPPLAGTRVLFYLDAHWEQYWPLLTELERISETHRDNCVIVIDDFKVPGRPDLPYDKYGSNECSFEYIKGQLDKVYSGYTMHYLIPKNPSARAKFVAYPTAWAAKAS